MYSMNSIILYKGLKKKLWSLGHDSLNCVCVCQSCAQNVFLQQHGKTTSATVVTENGLLPKNPYPSFLGRTISFLWVYLWVLIWKISDNRPL